MDIEIDMLNAGQRCDDVTNSQQQQKQKYSFDFLTFLCGTHVNLYGLAQLYGAEHMARQFELWEIKKSTLTTYMYTFLCIPWNQNAQKSLLHSLADARLP
jgi:hypothetical protein